MLHVIGRFYGPMALYYVLMLVSHIFVGIGFSRSASPTITFAAYGLAFAVTGFFSAVAYSVRSLVLVQGIGRESFRMVTRLTVLVSVLMAIGQTVVSFTPVGTWVFSSLLHAAGELLSQSILASIVLPVMVLADGARGLFHGRLVVQKRPGAMLAGMLLRNVALVIWLLIAHWMSWDLGALLGTVAMTLAILVEAAVALAAVLWEPAVTEEAGQAAVPSLLRTIRLFLPLAGTAVIAAIVPLVVSGTIARVPNPELNLAAYQVASGVGGLFFSLMHPVSDIVVVYARAGVSARQAVRFGLSIGAAIGLLLFFLGLRSIGQPVLHALYGTPESLGNLALKVVHVKAVLAVIETGRLCLFGIAVLRANTQAIFLAKGFGILAASAAALLLPRTGASIGVWIMATASAAEILIFLYAFSERGLRTWLPMNRKLST